MDHEFFCMTKSPVEKSSIAKFIFRAATLSNIMKILRKNIDDSQPLTVSQKVSSEMFSRVQNIFQLPWINIF